MVVCLCKNVTEGQLRQAVCEGHRTIRDLRSYLGVASQCGKCGKCAKGVLKECLSQNR